MVVDVRGTGTTQATAEAGIHRVLIRYQGDLDEVVILVADDLGVLFMKFRVATRTCSELDREIRAKQTG
ncbi:hypothetical protein [Nocardioides sp. AE5]|uniref:hypothetical protein n=1 Tax=Nocardioides sp. AE5 TaxID=2962573 RepID=UPI0028815A27|nr:hypothetical protein [Nocardioides sp. AE5]MDT0203760.1 hypothetical protein [Nocardioides sp. AE5]